MYVLYKVKGPLMWRPYPSVCPSVTHYQQLKRLPYLHQISLQVSFY